MKSTPSPSLKDKLVPQVTRAQLQANTSKKNAKAAKADLQDAKRKFKEAKRLAKKDKKVLKALQAELAAASKVTPTKVAKKVGVAKKAARRKSAPSPTVVAPTPKTDMPDAGSSS